MSKLISGKEALIALANGEEVECYKHEWMNVDRLSVRDLTSSDNMYKFRLKPHTITINGIEVPAPFEPKEGVDGHIIDLVVSPVIWDGSDPETYRIGAWRTEEEIKQVVAALRSVFKTT